MTLPALKDLFARNRAKATGLWRLGLEPNRTVFLESGDIVFASSTFPQDRLTHLLVERSKITQAQLDYAMANLNPGMSIGKNLIEMGFITQRDLLEVARAQVERVVAASMATPNAIPSFESRELDATTVRLPFDTPGMLLSGVLSLEDREAVLEELGPLNQVVVLEGRRHQELTLTPDLAKLPTLLDGSRTLMELSREAGVEPFRLGAFVLFLREMGWARLHELPPLDRRALERALDPQEAAITPALPEPGPAPSPSLFHEIRASQSPTTNLEHLSEALDKLGPNDEVAEEVSEPFPAEDVFQTVPAEPEPVVPLEPALPNHHEAEGITDVMAPPPPPLEVPGPPARKPWALLLVLLVLVAGWLGYKGWKGYRAKHPAAPKVQPKAPVPSAKAHLPTPAKPTPEPPKPTPAEPVAVSPALPPTTAPAPAKPEPVKPQPVAPKEEPVAPKAQRLEAILHGDWNKALAQGAAQRKALQGKWTLRLEIACQGSTVQHAADLLKDRDPDLFLVAMAMRDGRSCYQIFLGSFGSDAAAKEAAKKLPAPFLAEGNRPKPFRVAQIPDRQ